MTLLRSFTLVLLLMLAPLSFSSLARNEVRGEQLSRVSGFVVNELGTALPGISIAAESPSGSVSTETDSQGRFDLVSSAPLLRLRLSGSGIRPASVPLPPNHQVVDLRVEVRQAIPPVHDTLVIRAASLDAGLERRNSVLYEHTLFSRDDQVISALDAGIDAGQHEGGGKSIEIRRFGFNLDHGGVNGGLKVLIDNVGQNQPSQGHGQGYLGSLKSLSPELVQDVDILDGPFSSEYGDFSSMGVVHVRLRESLPDRLNLRVQGGSFGLFRTFLGYSPNFRNTDSFVAWETSRTDGPFLNPLNYTRHNLTGNLTRKYSDESALGFRLNAGTNSFNSSGQIPLDEVAAGRLDRFGFLDRENGGMGRSATAAVYHRKPFASGDVLKLDGFISRSLFDLFSNFTFFLDDLDRGDAIQQHDSRLQQGVNLQHLHLLGAGGGRGLLTTGANFHDSQINVGLYPSLGRVPNGAKTSSDVRVTNLGGYVQEAGDYLGGLLHVSAGLRWDLFRFTVQDRLTGDAGGQTSGRAQPKLSLVVRPSQHVPARLFWNYGRGIASQDARGVIQQPEGPKISTTDFYQFGTSFLFRDRLSLTSSLFLVDRSNEQVYVPDDGSIEFRGPSRSYGYQARLLVRASSYLTFNAGLTNVGNAFYRGTFPREYVDSAPRLVNSAGITCQSGGLIASLRYRHTSGYRLDGWDPGIRASGLDVVDLSLTKRVRPDLDLSLAVDNLTNKRFYETQNYFESRLTPGAAPFYRIHGTPGYPLSVAVGATYRLGR
jgi:outer membrane receptor protein involved in Fe transport